MPEWLINLGYAALACLTVGFILALIGCFIGIAVFVRAEFFDPEERRKWFRGKTDRR